jgi:hypothetical protein
MAFRLKCKEKWNLTKRKEIHVIVFEYWTANWKSLLYATCWRQFVILSLLNQENRTVSFISEWCKYTKHWPFASPIKCVHQTLHIDMKKAVLNTPKRNIEHPAKESEALGKQAESCCCEHPKKWDSRKYASTLQHRAGRCAMHFCPPHTQTGPENSSLPHRRYQINLKINKHMLLTHHSFLLSTIYLRTLKCHGPGSCCTLPNIPSKRRQIHVSPSHGDDVFSFQNSLDWPLKMCSWIHFRETQKKLFTKLLHD